MDVAWAGDEKLRENVRKNHEAAEKAMLAAEKSDLYVLPEMWNTGFVTKPEDLFPEQGPTSVSTASAGETGVGGETLAWMQRMADKLDAAVAGSVAVRLTDGSYRNRLYFVKPAPTPDPSPEAVGRESNCQPCEQSIPSRGKVWRGAFYDKHHLFTYGGEHLHYTPGEERVTVEWRGVRFRLCTCYDLRFPLWLRCRDDYDALICVASWPTVRMHAWRVLLQARAIENQCYVLGVNRVGDDPVCQYSGGTAFVNPYGEMTTCPEDEASVLTQTIDMEHLRTFRGKFPVLKEAD